MKLFLMSLVLLGMAAPASGQAREKVLDFVVFESPDLLEQGGAFEEPRTWLSRSLIGPRYPLIGTLVGIAGGVVWGTVLMNNSDDYVGPPAHVMTVPVGALVGFVGGLIAGAALEP